jgi:hypothetical protein
VSKKTLGRHKVTTEDGRLDFTVLPDKLYGSRLPNYHRLDARATRTKKTERGEVGFYLELVNLTNHKNVFGYDYLRSPGTNGSQNLVRDPETWFTILPLTGISWTR